MNDRELAIIAAKDGYMFVNMTGRCLRGFGIHEQGWFYRGHGYEVHLKDNGTLRRAFKSEPKLPATMPLARTMALADRGWFESAAAWTYDQDLRC